MSNVNWNQFLNTFANNFNKVTTNNVQNNIVNNSMAQQNQQQTPLQTLLPQTTMQLQQTTSELQMLNQEQNMMMLKDLLNFPKNFEQLLNKLATNPEFAQIKSALMLLASTVDMSKLTNLLQNNSKNATANLYQLLAQYNQLGISIKEEQMIQITKLISFVAAAASNEIQSLKTVMLMYLPWLPLTEPNSFRMEIIEGGQDETAEQEESVSILVSTENYGDLKADIYKTDEEGITIYLLTSTVFPQKKLLELINTDSKKYSIHINVEMGSKEEFKPKDGAKFEIFMNVSSQVNPFLLLISNTIINHLHIIDTKMSLDEKRKEKINNGKS